MLLSVNDKLSDTVLVERGLLLGWIRVVDFGIRAEKIELEGVADEITVDRAEL